MMAGLHILHIANYTQQEGKPTALIYGYGNNLALHYTGRDDLQIAGSIMWLLSAAPCM